MNRAPSCRECHREMNETREKREKERNILRSGVRMYTRHNAFKWSCAIENGHARRCQRSLTKEQDHSAGSTYYLYTPNFNQSSHSTARSLAVRIRSANDRTIPMDTRCCLPSDCVPYELENG